MYNFRYYAIGHSYLKHSAFVGWQTSGEWGMAASEPSKDYFHQLQDILKTEFDCSVEAIAENRANYERLCVNGVTEEDYKNSVDYKQMKDVILKFKPNIITVFVGGGNTIANDCKSLTLFYDVLLGMIAETKQPDAVTVCVNLHDTTYKALIGVTKKYGFYWADASFIHAISGRNNPYYAFNDYPEYDEKAKEGAVEFRTHPNDKGHRKIAECIFDAFKTDIVEKIKEDDDCEEHVEVSEIINDKAEYKVVTNPDMKLVFGGFNFITAENYVGFSSAPGTGASVTAEKLDISGYSKFVADVEIDTEYKDEELIFEAVTEDGCKKFRTRLKSDEMVKYEYDISGIKGNITSFKLSPSVKECFMKVKYIAFEK